METLISMLLDFVAPLVFVGPPDAGADTFASGVDPRMAGGVLVNVNPPKRPVLFRISGVVEVDGVGVAGAKGLRKVDEDGAESRSYLSGVVPRRILSMLQRLLEVELDARAVLEHLEANGVFAADEFLVGIDANIEVVVEQIVVGAVWAVGTAQDVGLCRFEGGYSRLARAGLLRRLRGGLLGRLCSDAILREE